MAWVEGNQMGEFPPAPPQSDKCHHCISKTNYHYLPRFTYMYRLQVAQVYLHAYIVRVGMCAHTIYLFSWLALLLWYRVFGGCR